MTLFFNLLMFALGLVLVVKGGDFFVDAASFIAKALRVPTFIIGATIVSLATTLPEMIVSVIAAAKGGNSYEMAVGNAVGSVTANTALILATAMLAMHIGFPRKKYIKQSLLLIGAVVVLFLSCLGGSLFFVGGIVLALIFAYFMFENVRSARKEPELPDPSGAALAKPAISKKQLALNIAMFIVGAGGIVGGSQLMVNFGEKIALALNVPENVIAVTLVAVGTSLPELVTTVTAIVKKESALSAGNVIGANIIDISLILPICSLVSGKQLPIAPVSLWFDLPVCLLVTLIALVPMIFRQKAAKWQGALLLVIYAAYIALTVFVMPKVFA